MLQTPSIIPFKRNGGKTALSISVNNNNFSQSLLENLFLKAVKKDNVSDINLSLIKNRLFLCITVSHNIPKFMEILQFKSINWLDFLEFIND